MVRVLFVCLGNICRSPTAEGVFRQHVAAAGLSAAIEVDSAGCAGYHVGEPPDRRSAAAAKKRGIDLSAQRARQVQGRDFEVFDYVLCADESNLEALLKLRAHHGQGEAVIGLFLSYASAQPDATASPPEIPDPYYGGDRGFEEVLDLCAAASEGLLLALGQAGHIAPQT